MRSERTVYGGCAHPVGGCRAWWTPERGSELSMLGLGGECGNEDVEAATRPRGCRWGLGWVDARARSAGSEEDG